MSNEDQEVVLTPLPSARPGGHVIRVERVALSHLNKAHVRHIAGGPYKGIIINKASPQDKPSEGGADSMRSFTACVADQSKGEQGEDTRREKRVLQFWFEAMARMNASVIEALTDTYMKELLDPDFFPKDYISFVKRVLTLVRQYSAVQRLELAIVPLTGEEDEEEIDALFRKTTTTTRVTTSSTKVAVGQEDYRRLADGTLVDSRGNIVHEDPGSMRMNGDRQLEMSSVSNGGVTEEHVTRTGGVAEEHVTRTVTTTVTVGASQEDYRLLADGTWVDSHGNILTEVPESMRMNGKGFMEKPFNNSLLERSDTSQDDCLTQQSFDRGFNVSLDGSPEAPIGTSTGNRGVLRRKPTITLKGWDMVWATKKQRLLNILEDAYPNVLNVDDLVRASSQKPEDVEYLMGDLQIKGMIKEIGHKRWIRMPQERKLVVKKQRSSRSSRSSMDMSMDEGDKRRHEFKVVAHIPRLEEKEQPTVAIITLLYCEKLAVDAMMDFKTTYIRVKKTEGEGLVYTVGKIGGHRVVATKLPRIGHGQGATVSAGNSITRLMGTFGRIEHVILVGVGGGVANLKNESRHVKLGDIVVSSSLADQPAYIHLKDLDEQGDGPKFQTKSWKPLEHNMSNIVSNLYDDYSKNTFFGGDWEKYIADAEGELHGGDLRFSRPPPEADKLYKVQGETEIELEHPLSPVGSARDKFPNRPVIHLGPIGTGKQLSKEDNLRQEFAETYNVLCIDSGFHAVMDSIEGNRKDSFAIVRGISDYQDGTQRREWQAYASLVAAAFTKTVLMDIPWEEDSDDDN